MEAKINVVQQCYGHFGTGNIGGVLDLLTDDVVWVDPGYPDIPYAGKRTGKKEVATFFTEMGAAVSFTQFQPQQFLCDGDNVVTKGFFAGKSNHTGRTFETEWVMIWQVNDLGKVYHYQAYIDTHKLVAALH